MPNIKVFDNGGRSKDRFTIYLLDEHVCIKTNGRPHEIWDHVEYEEAQVKSGEREIPMLTLPYEARERLFNEVTHQLQETK